MAKNRTEKNCFHYRMTHQGFNYSVKEFWRERDPVTPEDEVLLKGVKYFYEQNGYSPCKADMLQEVCILKARFRTWKNVLLAAGLPPSNDAEGQRKRQEKDNPKR